MPPLATEIGVIKWAQGPCPDTLRLLPILRKLSKPYVAPDGTVKAEAGGRLPPLRRFDCQFLAVVAAEMGRFGPSARGCSAA
jgi:hypothetical protein